MSTGLDRALEYHVVNSLGWPDLRPLQRDAVEPVRAGADCLLLAPTAGGKTEAAVFPLLSEMVAQDWQGVSVLYVTPLRALLNNLYPRLEQYCSWLGRRAGLWHGDVGQGDRRRILTDPPNLLLTTPESLEAMLVSKRVDHEMFFSSIRALVVDELHAFAGDDRGWHLLAVLERIQRLAGRRIQRIGLSATVGNPDELQTWLQGGTPAGRAEIVAPETGAAAGEAEVTLDYVGSVANAAMVVSRLHHGEKRLVFAESRAQAEDMANSLRDLGILTFITHSSLSQEERRRSEQAFAEARDCVVVATSALELGIDVGDLDRVIQLDSPRTVASFLQRMGRTGRRPGTTRNTLFLATNEDALLQAAGLLSLWRKGFVEPVQPPPNPRHIEAQQLLALALQEGAIGLNTWHEWWPEFNMMADGDEILDFLLSGEFLSSDSGMGFVSDATEYYFGRRNFMDLMAVFTVEPELRVVAGRRPIGTISLLSFATSNQGRPTYLALAGRSWRVTNIDWRKRVVSVVEEPGAARSKWLGRSIGRGLSREMAQSIRSVLLGEQPEVELSRRAIGQLELLREERSDTVDEDGIILARHEESSRLWTFAGDEANRSIAAAINRTGVTATSDSFGANAEGLLDRNELVTARDLLAGPNPIGPVVDQTALNGLKFNAALPRALAEETLSERLADSAGGLAALSERIVLSRQA
jgi:ATP-dependent Lhr-like helicase